MAETEDTAPPETTSAVGERLRAAREEKGLALEDIATQTRIPRRHLEAIEAGDWSQLPAPTYTIGFAKSYASAVGLDRTEVGEEVRTEIGGSRPMVTTTAEVFEPTDPARTMPRWLVLAALGAIVLAVIAMTWLNNRSLEQPEAAPEATAADTAATPAPAVQQPQPAAAAGPVLLTATERVWLQVYERDGRTLFQGELGDGQHYQVPATATDPLLRTGKPQALRITVGGEVAPPVGPPAETVSGVSLRGPALLNGAGATIPAPSAPPGVQNSAG